MFLLADKIKKMERQLVKAHLRQGRQLRPPFSINVEPTNYCNLKCPICPHGSIPPPEREKGMLTLQAFDRILDRCHPTVKTMALYLHGEPFLNPQLPEMASKAYQAGIAVSIYSNGLILKSHQVEQAIHAKPRVLLISMDLISPSGYMHYKGEDSFIKAADQLNMIADVCSRTKSRTRLILRSIYNGESEEQIAAFLDKWTHVKGIKEIQISCLFPWPKKKDADILSGKMAKRGKECSQIWNAVNVLWDGRVTPCSFDYEASYVIGNINTMSLKEIINSPQARYFRKMHILGKKENIPMCSDCFIPKFQNSVVPVKSGKYVNMSDEEKENLIQHIKSLKFSPLQDFPVEAPL